MILFACLCLGCGHRFVWQRSRLCPSCRSPRTTERRFVLDDRGGESIADARRRAMAMPGMAGVFARTILHRARRHAPSTVEEKAG